MIWQYGEHLALGAPQQQVDALILGNVLIGTQVENRPHGLNIITKATLAEPATRGALWRGKSNSFKPNPNWRKSGHYLTTPTYYRPPIDQCS